MTDNVDNLILAQLREMRADLGRIERDMTAMRQEMLGGFDAVSGRVDGVATLLTLPAGHVHHIDERVEKLEGSLAR